jgi:DNA-directed RNA polymerase sigma subunit (sigma70/sigma32)
MSLSEIGAEMGYSKERIRQIEVQGLSSLIKRFEHNLHRPDRKLVI